jgi:hypothetical protein
VKKLERGGQNNKIHKDVDIGNRGRENTFRRFNALVEYEFREPLFSYVYRYKAAKTDEQRQRQRLKQKIGELNSRILEAKKALELNAPGDV